MVMDDLILQRGWYGVDLDGTLAQYTGQSAFEIGPAIPRMVERVKRWLKEGRRVKIVTARCDDGTLALEMGDKRGKDYSDTAKVRETIKAFCLAQFGQELEITNKKDYGMIVLYDDRAITVQENTGKILSWNIPENLTPARAAVEYLRLAAILAETPGDELDSPEADEIRDDMDEYWYVFSSDSLIKQKVTEMLGLFTKVRRG